METDKLQSKGMIHKMRADRLLSILLLLQNQGMMSTRRLAEQLEVSERTITRDLEALSASGIPVYAERGSQGGWALAESYRTNLTGMRKEEVISLLLTHHSGLLGDLGIQEHFQSAYQKLLAASPAPIRQDAEMIRQRIHIDGAGWHASEETFPWLPLVQEAVWAQQKLWIRYKKDHEVAERIINPLGLIAKRNVWYVAAERNGELRTYRVSKLEEARLMEKRFERPEGFNLAEYWEQSTVSFKSRLPRYPAQIRITEPRLKRLQRERYAKVLCAEPDAGDNGFLFVDIEFQTLESACELILACGSEIEVLEPAELRERVMSEAKAIWNKYVKQ